MRLRNYDHQTLLRITKEAEGLSVAIAARDILARIPIDPHAEEHRTELLRGLDAVCGIKGCLRTSRSTGLCDTHYRQMRRAS